MALERGRENNFIRSLYLEEEEKHRKKESEREKKIYLCVSHLKAFT